MTKDKERRSIGDFLREKREARKLKQSDVSKKTGIDPSVICRYEKNQSHPSLRKMNDLITGYQLTEDEEKEFREICSLRDVVFDKIPREFQILSQLLMLPQDIRKRIIQAAIAYNSSEPSNSDRK
ncbi:MAG: helix-turn-helix transcriptional regulator [Patescibacteria group bacterium]